MNTFNKLFVFYFVLLVLASCTPKYYKYRTFDGGNVPAYKIATLIVPENITINELDSKPYKPLLSNPSLYLGAEIKMLTGKHFLKILLLSKDGRAANEILIDFYAKGGRSYTFSVEYHGNKVRIGIYEITPNMFTNGQILYHLAFA